MDQREGREILEEILRHSAAPEGFVAPPQVLREMISVATQHRDQAITLEQATGELVGAALQALGGGPTPGPDDPDAMYQQIARSLCQDPVARPRIEALWEQLLHQGEKQ